jgi:COP9 signalosome complex subunit 1
VARAQLKCAVALAHLEGTRYKPAALAFAQAGPDLGTDWSDVATPADIAIAGALTAMASLSRSELKASVIDSPAFREHLAAAPEARDALQDFYASRYSDCLRALEGLRPRLAVDPRLASHADGLLKGVRASALAQAAAPYSALDLRTLALEFGAEKG